VKAGSVYQFQTSLDLSNPAAWVDGPVVSGTEAVVEHRDFTSGAPRFFVRVILTRP
jgi:hypothetical protein